MPLPMANGGTHVSSKSLPNTTILLQEGDESPRLLHQFQCQCQSLPTDYLGIFPSPNGHTSAPTSAPVSAAPASAASGVDDPATAPSAAAGTDGGSKKHQRPVVSFTATLLISIYQMENISSIHTGKKKTITVACINVQLTPTAEPFSAIYRESLHRIELETTETGTSTITESQLLHHHPPPMAKIANNYLICMVASQLIIFQLRKPLKQPVTVVPPLPPYITKSMDDSTSTSRSASRQAQLDVTSSSWKPIIPVATNPRRVHGLTDVLSFCNLDTMIPGCSLLLASRDNGDIVAITYRDAQLAGTLLVSSAVTRMGGVSNNGRPAVAMCHVSMGKRGKLVCLSSDGQATFFESHALVGSESDTTNVSISTNDYDANDSFQDERDVSEQTSSKRIPGLLRIPSSRTNMVHVNLIPLPHLQLSEKYRTMTWIDSNFLVLLAAPSSSNVVAQVVTIHDSSVHPVSTLTMTKERLSEVSNGSFSVHQVTKAASPYNVTYDSQSACILVATQLHASDHKVLPFVCCWHWRSNTTSLVLSSTTSMDANESYISTLSLEKGLDGVRRFVLICSSTKGWKKTMYQTAVLSPNHTLMTASAIQEETPLLLGSDFVMFPVCTKTCAIHRTELEWRSANLPASYLASCGGGPPVLASITNQDCRSIAISSLLGLCILDVSYYFSSLHQQSSGSIGAPVPKWKRFDKAEESSFRVLGMKWWEDSGDEDLLLTVIETSDRKRHLACWSRKRLVANQQLIRSVDDAEGSSSWGILLPSTFSPNSISVLSSGRKAVLLLTDCVGTIIVFHLQRTASEEPLVKSSLALYGGLNPGIEQVFLASASHDFDLEKEDRITQLDDYVGVIGMICRGQLIATVVTRGSLVSEETVVTGVVSKIMLSEEVGGTYSWMIELCNGTIWCWTAPATEHPSPPSKFVLIPPTQIGKGSFAPLLGTVSCVGDSAMWMLGSSSTTQSQFVVGAIPLSNHGCILKVGQEGVSHHRVIAGDAAELYYDVFSLGNSSIAPPAFLPSLLNHLLSSPGDSQGTSNSLAGAKHQFLNRLHSIRSGHAPSTSNSLARARHHFMNRLQFIQSGHAAFVTLRLLVLRSVELVTATKKNKVAFKQASDLFARIIDLLDDTYLPYPFAWLLLSLARQVEPSCMDYLFPLPSASSPFQTIEDLFLECVKRGSLATPSAALPLLSTKLMSLEVCKDIFYHCLVKLSSTFVELPDAPFDTTREERLLVRDLFRFANQLEQMDEAEFWSDSKLDVNIMTTAEEKRLGVAAHVTPIKTPERKQRSAFGIFMPLVCSGRRRREERAVYEAASTFIGSGFEEFEYADVDIPITQVVGPVSVVFVTGKLLVRLSLEEKHGWKKSAVIARLVLGDTAIDESGKGVLRWVQSTPLSSLAVAAHRLSRSADYLDCSDGDEMADEVTNFLVQGMFAANHDMTRADASWLLELLVLSLSRLSPKDLVNHSLAPALILMVIIVGHVSGRMEDMFRDMQRKNLNPLMICYEEAKRLANSYT